MVFVRLTQTFSMEIIKTNRGGEKLCLDGYMYVKKRTYTSWIRWNCHHSRTTGCQGSVTTDDTFENPRSLVLHNHPADRTGVEVTKLRTVLKAQAKQSRSKPNQLVTQALLEATEDVRSRIGNINTVKRDLQRQQSGNQPKDPSSLQELLIPEDWKLTGGNPARSFLIYDSGPEDHRRIVIYAADRQLRLLGASDTWFMDGNFAMSPSIFEQLYVIRARLGDTAVSCVYAFLPGKSSSIYQDMLQAVMNKLQDLGIFPDPSTIVTDFEQAAIQAVGQVLGPHVTSQGCFYHLCQSTWRKIQELGLAVMYRTDEEVKHFVGMLDGLAFLPEDKVQDGMTYLKDHTPDGLEGLVHYFDATYVTGTYRRVQQQVGMGAPQRLRLRHIPPRFPVTVWNVHQTTIEGRERTNNACEGWNSSFSKLVGHHHPSFWTAVDCLRKDCALVSTQITQHTRGQLPRKRQRRAQKELQKRLQRLCIDLTEEQRTLEGFLEAVGHNIRLE